MGIDFAHIDPTGFIPLLTAGLLSIGGSFLAPRLTASRFWLFAGIALLLIAIAALSESRAHLEHIGFVASVTTFLSVPLIGTLLLARSHFRGSARGSPVVQGAFALSSFVVLTVLTGSLLAILTLARVV
jgi:hypothetical protein